MEYLFFILFILLNFLIFYFCINFTYLTFRENFNNKKGKTYLSINYDNKNNSCQIQYYNIFNKKIHI